MITSEKYGPWAVIAGGSEGLGPCFARRLARAGINLVLLARKPGPLTETAREIEQQSRVQVRTLQVDLTQPDMLQCIRTVTDGLDVGLLIYNAGAAHGPKLLVDQSADEALAVVRLNAIGQTLLAQHFGKAMVQRGRGGILLVSSGASIAGCYSLTTYSASKAYTQVFGEGLWAELQPHGVDVLVLTLARTRTPALARTDIAQDAPAADPDDMAEQGLAHLADGPVYVPTHLAQAFRQLSAMPRRAVIELMSKSLRPRSSDG
jgi:uncharacterized protein